MAELTSKDGLALHYTDEGNGPPLLCLPGIHRSSEDFDYMAARLAGTRITRMDYRGRGKSAHDPNPKNYSVPVEAADALLLMDHLGIKRFSVLGSSRGGIIAMYLAKAAPDRIQGIFLNDIGPVLEEAGFKRLLETLGKKPRQRSLAEMARDMPAMNPGFESVPERRWMEEASRQFAETPEGLAIRYDPRLRDALLGAPAPPDLWPLFDAIGDIPIALARGSGSDFLSGRTAAEMRRRRPGMLHAEIKGRGHIPFLDEPESLSLARDFLEACRE